MEFLFMKIIKLKVVENSIIHVYKYKKKEYFQILKSKNSGEKEYTGKKRSNSYFKLKLN